MLALPAQPEIAPDDPGARLVPYPIGRAPGQRYRIEQWASLLRFLSEHGHNVLYDPGRALLKARETMRGYLSDVGEVLRLVSADVIFLYREGCLVRTRMD